MNDLNDLFIDKNEVLRYLGYNGQVLDENTEGLLHECINEIRAAINVRYTYKTFELKKYDEKITLKECTLELEGKDIYKHLNNSNCCILMAVTLGGSIDMRIRYYEKSNMTKALIMDACATTAVEEVCDKLCLAIEAELKGQEKKLTSRFSPGYGDLALSIQGEFISVLEADKKIGLKVSSHSILIPRKSVTAVAGIIDMNSDVKKSTCHSCSKYYECDFKRRDGCCGT